MSDGRGGGLDVVITTWAEAREALLEVRVAVFVQEQGVDPALDLDGADYRASDGHLFLSFDGSGTVGVSHATEGIR